MNEVTIGDHLLSTTNSHGESEKVLSVSRIVRHNFNPRVDKTGDIAILELSQEVYLTTYTPACLARTKDKNTFDGKLAVALGKEVWVWMV